jgi:hypothetical protein
MTLVHSTGLIGRAIVSACGSLKAIEHGKGDRSKILEIEKCEHFLFFKKLLI